MCGIIGIYNYEYNSSNVDDTYVDEESYSVKVTNNVHYNSLQKKIDKINSNLLSNIINKLKLLQNRGRDSYGILLLNKNSMYLYKDIGSINEERVYENYEEYTFLNNQKKLVSDNLYNIGIGHIRYSTSYNNHNKISLYYALPFNGTHPILGEFHLIHNGNINFKPEFVKRYYTSYETNNQYNDSQLLVKIIENIQANNWLELIRYIIDIIPGAFNVIIATGDMLIGFKDIFNVRPFCLGKNHRGFCLSSESNALQDFKLVKEIDGGEIVVIRRNTYLCYKYTPSQIKTDHTLSLNNNRETSSCLFEYIYFMNNNSVINNTKIYDIRYNFGIKLASKEASNFLFNDSTSRNDIVVIGSPDTGIPSGKGFADHLNLNYIQFIKKKKKSGRSFILSNDAYRINECKKKFLVDETLSIKNKVVFFTDDSLVRGHTIFRVVKLLKEYHPKEIHIRIAAPKIKNTCKLGIDLPTKDELLMADLNDNEARSILKINSIKFLTELDMVDVMNSSLNNGSSSNNNNNEQKYCLGCFNGTYNNKLLDW